VSQSPFPIWRARVLQVADSGSLHTQLQQALHLLSVITGTQGTPHTLKSSLREGYNFRIMVNVLAKLPQENHHNIQNSPY